ncbi:MAG: hypothetical protein ACRCYQ_16750 [Nocardioides sp.]
MIGPDQDISEFPPWAWPRIRTVWELDTVIAATVQRHAVAVLPHEIGEALARSITAATARAAAAGSTEPVDIQLVDDFGDWWCPVGVPLLQWFRPGRPRPNWAHTPLESVRGSSPSPWPIKAGLAEAAFVLLELAGGVEKFGSPALQDALIPLLKEAAESPTG